VANRLAGAFVEVGGNVEVVVIPNPNGVYALSVADVPDRARGGTVYLGDRGFEVQSLTADLRSGTNQFTFNFGPPGNPGDRGIASALAVLRDLVSGAPVSLSLPDVSGGESTTATSTVFSASSTGLAPRSTGAGGRARQARFDTLQALAEVLADVWTELLKGREGAGDEPTTSSDNAELLPMLRAITRVLDEMLKSGAVRPNTRQGKSSDRQSQPDAPPSIREQAIRSHADGQLDFQALQRHVSRGSASSSPRIPDSDPHAAGVPARPAAALDSQANPNNTSADGNSTAGSQARASAS
jgi:hypothetical protein